MITFVIHNKKKVVEVMANLEITILIPCLNEEDTISECVLTSKRFIKENNLKGEVLVVDNDSIDKSYNLAKKSGARVIKEKQKGYGSALIKGIKEARGKYIIMGDADCSYDFLKCSEFVYKLRDGYDLIVGNRFSGGIEKNAMPFTHRYIGNPILSFIGTRLFRITEVGDFHCGLRAFKKDAVGKLDLQCLGMDFASEMIIKAKLNHLKMTEVPITLHKDKRINTRSHLSTIKDGIIHLKTMMRIYWENRKV